MFGPSKAELAAETARADAAESKLAAIMEATGATVTMSDGILSVEAARNIVAAAFEQMDTGVSIGEEAKQVAVGMIGVQTRAAMVDELAEEILSDETKLRKAAQENPKLQAELKAEARAALDAEGKIQKARDEADEEYRKARYPELITEEKKDATSELDTKKIDAEIKADPAFKAEVGAMKENSEQTYREEARLRHIADAKSQIEAELEVNKPGIGAEAITAWKNSKEGIEYRALIETTMQNLSNEELAEQGIQTLEHEELIAEKERRADAEALELQNFNTARDLLKELKTVGLNLQSLEEGTKLEITLGSFEELGIEVAYDDIHTAVADTVERVALDCAIQQSTNLYNKMSRGFEELRQSEAKEKLEAAITYAAAEPSATGVGADTAGSFVADYVSKVLNELAQQGVIPGASKVIINANRTLTLVKNGGQFELLDEYSKDFEAHKDALEDPTKLLTAPPSTVLSVGSSQKRVGQDVFIHNIRLGGKLVVDIDPASEELFDTLGGEIAEVKINGISCHHGSVVEYV